MSVTDQRAQALKRAAMVARVFASPEGEVALGLLETEAGFHRSCYVKGDPYETTYREGKRDMVLYIHEMIESSQKASED